MKKIKYLLVVLMISLCLVGCGSKKEEQKEEETKEEVNEKDKDKENKPEIEIDKSKNVSWIGKYEMDNASDGEVFIELSIEADNPYLTLDVSRITYSYENPNDDGFGSIESMYYSFYLDNVSDDEIIIDDEFMGIKGTITRTDKGLNFVIDHDEEGTHYFAEGTYSLYNDETEIRGYYVNDKMRVAISPLSDYSRVSVTPLVDDIDESFSTLCSPGPVIKYDDYEGYFTIEKTENGIKIDSDKEYLAGEYVLEK